MTACIMRGALLTTFSWVDWSRAGPWGATDVLHDGDGMTVTDNVVMQ